MITQPLVCFSVRILATPSQCETAKYRLLTTNDHYRTYKTQAEWVHAVVSRPTWHDELTPAIISSVHRKAWGEDQWPLLNPGPRLPPYWQKNHTLTCSQHYPCCHVPHVPPLKVRNTQLTIKHPRLSFWVMKQMYELFSGQEVGILRFLELKHYRLNF